MHKIRLVALIMLAAVMCSGCKFLQTGILNDEEVRNFTQKIEDLALVLPGGRYNMLIEDIASGTPERKERAKKWAENLLNIKLDIPYEVTAWFVFDDKKGQLRADIIQADTFVDLEMETIAEQPVLFQNPVKAARSRLLTSAELNKKVSASLKEAVNLIAGDLSEPPCISGMGCEVPTLQRKAKLTGPMDITPGDDPINEAKLRDSKDRGRFIELVQKAIALHYDQSEDKLPDVSLTLPWAPGRGPYIFVILDKEDFIRHQASLRVELLLHEARQPSKSFGGAGIKVFQLGEFAHTVKIKNTGREVVWAVQNVTGIPSLNQKTLDAITALDKLAKQLKERSKTE